jgi:hypothetical protein
VLWLVVSALVVVACAYHHDHPTQFENDLFEALNGLPNAFKGFFEALFELGTLWGVGLVVVAGCSRAGGVGRPATVRGSSPG